MRKLVFASILGAAVIAAPSLYAQGGKEPSGSMMDHGMTGDMMGMMKMMKQMSQMMDHCSNMMSDSRPNDQWKKNTPSEKKG